MPDPTAFESIRRWSRARFVAVWISATAALGIAVDWLIGDFAPGEAISDAIVGGGIISLRSTSTSGRFRWLGDETASRS